MAPMPSMNNMYKMSQKTSRHFRPLGGVMFCSATTQNESLLSRFQECSQGFGVNGQ